MRDENVVLRLEGICKEFPGVKALQNVEFTLRKGEIHALMGENGAGKSTLIKVLTGVYEKDGGNIYMSGNPEPVVIRSTQDAQKAGISTVYQEITLCPNLTVAENMYIGRSKGAFTKWKKMYSDAGKLLESLDIPARPNQQLGSCSLAVQQMVAIARAVDMDCKVLILDEPTSSLDEQEVEKLFKLMLDLKSRGVGIIFVTHFLDQVYAVCDKITVLRDGKFEGEYNAADLPKVELVSKMLGKDLNKLSDMDKPHEVEQETNGEAPVFEAEGLVSSAGIAPFNFSIRKGEVNGFTGLLGSGRSESVRAIFGADSITGGTVRMNGKTVKIRKPLDAMKHGISYLPEDRKHDGIIGDLSVKDNIILALQVMRGMFRPISKADAAKYADEYIKLLEIKTASPDTPIKSLSGGNQQKVILARELDDHPEMVIANQPTRGLDIGASEYVRQKILDARNDGAAVLLVSADLEEILQLSDRIAVIYDGKIMGILPAGTDTNTIGMLMLGHKQEEKA